MADTAKRLAGPVELTGSEATVYTVPGSTTAILRSIRIVNSSSSSATVRASIGADAIGTRIIPLDFAIPAHGSYDWSGFYVLAAAETLRARASGSSALTFSASGVEVT